mgnify:CR=1 FL=1
MSCYRRYTDTNYFLDHNYMFNIQLIHCLIFLRAYRRMIAMMIVMIPLILLKYPFLMMLDVLVAKMPI